MVTARPHLWGKDKPNIYHSLQPQPTPQPRIYSSTIAPPQVLSIFSASASFHPIVLFVFSSTRVTITEYLLFTIFLILFLLFPEILIQFVTAGKRCLCFWMLNLLLKYLAWSSSSSHSFSRYANLQLITMVPKCLLAATALPAATKTISKLQLWT